LSGFRIHSSLEFTIELDQPVSFFPTLLSHNGAAIIPEGTAEAKGAWGERVSGTGPFRVVRFEPGRLLELEANPTYWRSGYPKSEGVIFNFGVAPPDILTGFQSGRFSLVSDLFPGDVDTLRHSKHPYKYREIPQLSTYYAVFNAHKQPLSDEKLRHLLVRSIDVEGLIRRTVGRLAIPAHSLLPPGLLGYEPKHQRTNRPSSDLSHADNVELVAMTGSVYDGPYASLANEFFLALESKGFRIKMDPLKADTTDVRVNTSQIDLSLTRWFGDYPDADTFFHSLLYSQGGLHGKFCGMPEMDRLIDRGRTENHPQVRHNIYQEAEELIAKRALLLPLFHEQTYRFAIQELEDFDLSFSLQIVPYDKLWIRR
jgi:ABC-type oligopeptide transport system substrate-binding subunit